MVRVFAWSRGFRRVAGVCVLAAFAGSAPAWGQEEESDPIKEARQMFHQALELEQAGNWAGALRMFREVSQVKMTPQVRFHIAVCEENLGKLVAALGGYELALADADSVGESFRVEVEEKVEAIRGRIPKIVIERGEGAEAASIELDGIVLGESSIGVEVPVDPGPHMIAAKASGFDDYSTTVDVAERATETVSVTLTKVAEPPPPVVDEPPPPPPKEFPIVPVALIGGGGVALLGSGAMLLMRSVALNDYRNLCPGDVCPPKSQLTPDDEDAIKSSRNKVMTYGVLSPVLAVVGLGAAGAGVYLLVQKPKDEAEAALPSDRTRAHVRLSPEVAGDGFGLTLSGRF
jgi:hypothetical protein